MDKELLLALLALILALIPITLFIFIGCVVNYKTKKYEHEAEMKKFKRDIYFLKEDLELMRKDIIKLKKKIKDI